MITLPILTQLCLNSLSLGLVYGLMSVGLAMTFGVMGIVNIAHGAFYMAGAYVAYVLGVGLGLPPVVALLISVVLLFGLGAGIELLAVERTKADPNSAMLVTVGVALFLEYTVLAYMGGQTRSLTPLVMGVTAVSGYYLGNSQLIGSFVAVVVTAALGIFLVRTKTGKAIRMIASDRETSMVLGISVTVISLITFGIGAASAGLAGVLLSTVYPLNPDIGWNILVITFAVVTLGGVGSIRGTVVAGVIYALAQNIGGFYFASYSDVIPLAILIIVLIIRPSGLFGRVLLERA